MRKGIVRKVRSPTEKEDDSGTKNACLETIYSLRAERRKTRAREGKIWSGDKFIIAGKTVYMDINSDDRLGNETGT